MAVALSRVTPAVVQRLQVPVQVLLYAASVCIFAEYLVGWLHLPLPANLGRYGADADAHSLPRCSRLTGSALALAGCWRKCCCSLSRRWWRW